MKKLLPLIFLIVAFLIAQPAQSVSADTQTVNALDDVDDTSCDASHCSLREAVLYASPGDTIDFSVNLSGTIELDGDPLTIDKNLTIDGPGAAILAISGNTTSPSKKSRIFHVFSETNDLDVIISGLSITNGDASNLSGGGVYNEGENLTILNCILDNNSATEGGGIYNSGNLTIGYTTISNNTSTGGSGGGIYNAGILDLNNSTIAGNSAVSGAGGGAYNEGAMTVDNSTFFDNHADSNRYWGGGIGNRGTLTLTNSTLSANSADSSGAGLRHKGAGSNLTLANTIIANNTGAGDCQKDGDETDPITDGGYNLIEGTGNFACDLIDGVNGNIIGKDPALAKGLGDYGGPTPTLPILFISSPAQDAIPNGVNGCTAGVSTDQRGEIRAGGTDTNGYLACDIGAFEFASGAGYEFDQVLLPLLLR